MANRPLVFLGAAVTVVTLAACSGMNGGGGVYTAPTASPSSAASMAASTAPTASPTPVPTATAAPTPTPKPTVAPTPTPKPTVAPTATPAPTAMPTAKPPLGTASINGSSTFVTSAQLPVYTYSSDTLNHSTCTGGCLNAWPAVPAPTGSLPAPFTSFTRADNGTLQLEYKGRPLYTFVADSADMANGDGAVVGAGTFNLAHP